MLVRALAFFCGVSLAVLVGHGLCADSGTLEARRELLQQQHQDELQLRLQQNSRTPSPSSSRYCTRGRNASCNLRPGRMRATTCAALRVSGSNSSNVLSGTVNNYDKA